MFATSYEVTHITHPSVKKLEVYECLWFKHITKHKQ